MTAEHVATTVIPSGCCHFATRRGMAESLRSFGASAAASTTPHLRTRRVVREATAEASVAGFADRVVQPDSDLRWAVKTRVDPKTAPGGHAGSPGGRAGDTSDHGECSRGLDRYLPHCRISDHDQDRANPAASLR